MNELELLRVEDIVRIFHISRVTIYKWVNLARQNKHAFPLPVGGPKQRLLWSRAAIEKYCRSQSAPSPEEQAEKERRQCQDAAVIALLEHYAIPYDLESKRDNDEIAEAPPNEDEPRVEVSGPTFRRVNPPQKRRK